jgi:uncharacterized protein
MVTYHQLPPELFDRLASGAGGAEEIEALRATQVSKHLVLIGHVMRHWPDARKAGIVDALQRAQGNNPAAFQRVIGAPLVGAWASIAVRAVHHGKATDADVAHLGATAMVACAACGVHGSAEIPVRDGLASFPGLGSARCLGNTAEVTVHDGLLHVRSAGREVSTEDGPQWLPLRHLDGDASGLWIRVALEDLDPYRHGHHAPPEPRLPESEVARWRELFADAWQLLAGLLPERAAALAAGLGALVPLRQTDERAARSATIRHAFGVFGLTRPPTAADFAVTLVHEFQHSKLSAMLDVEVFSNPDDQGRYFAPWRTDPRPLAGLLQGIYAFVGVADTWRALREADGIAVLAEAQFAEARLQVDYGLSAVEHSGALTPAGVALATRLRASADALLAEPVAPAVTRAAEQQFARTQDAWRTRNGIAN